MNISSENFTSQKDIIKYFYYQTLREWIMHDSESKLREMSD